jgi:hypothetical protein
MSADINYPRLLLAAVSGFAAYFAFGFLVFALLPVLRDEYAKYPAVCRTQDSMKGVMPIGMAAMSFHPGAGLVQGTLFGALIGLFAVCSFVLHNHVNLNIGWILTYKQAIAYLLEWTLVGVVIGLIYRERT